MDTPTDTPAGKRRLSAAERMIASKHLGGLCRAVVYASISRLKYRDQDGFRQEVPFRCKRNREIAPRRVR